MIHPDTTVKNVSSVIGNGVFATKLIKKGTIIVVRDQFDIILSQEQYNLVLEPLKEAMNTYIYIDKHGHFVLSWDNAKFMNHSCESNTMMTDYDFEIAVRDIEAGEEITSEYGLLNVQESYELYCDCTNCRNHLKTDDIDVHAHHWDSLVLDSILSVFNVEQPLLPLLSKEIKEKLKKIINNEYSYSSVKNLKWRKFDSS